MSRLERNDLYFCGFTDEVNDADLVVYGAPFDSTTSFRPGTRFAPPRMREESWGLETYSPYQNLDLGDYKICDLGDLELPFGDSINTLKQLKTQTTEILAQGSIPLMIGGEHSLTIAPVEAVFEKYPDLEIVHFDAHTDLRDDYLGNRNSHASVIKRCLDLLGDGRIHSFGIRSGLREEFKLAHERLDFHPFDLTETSNIAEKLAASQTPIYLTIDLDVLDPSDFPGTGTPEPGGVNFRELLTALLSLQKCNIVAADIMELSPHYDTTGASTAAACKVLREVALMLAANK